MVEVTQADEAAAHAIYMAYKRSGKPCEGARLVAEIRIAERERGAGKYNQAAEEWAFLYYWKAEGMNTEQARIHAKAQVRAAIAQAIREQSNGA